MKLLVILIYLFSSIALFATEKEDIIRGVALDRINQFIEYKNINNEFHICVYNNDKLAKVFKNLYKDREYMGAYFMVDSLSSLNNLDFCNVLYVDSLDKKAITKVISKISQQTLLVCEDEDAVYDGFMIALYFKNNKLRFAVNQDALNKAGLKVNYRLLQVASKIITKSKVK